MNLTEIVPFFLCNISLHYVHSEKDLIELSLFLMIHQQIYPDVVVSWCWYPQYINLEYHLERLSPVFSLLPLL